MLESLFCFFFSPPHQRSLISSIPEVGPWDIWCIRAQVWHLQSSDQIPPPTHSSHCLLLRKSNSLGVLAILNGFDLEPWFYRQPSQWWSELIFIKENERQKPREDTDRERTQERESERESATDRDHDVVSLVFRPADLTTVFRGSVGLCAC